ncbi:MAG: hypothetical protein RLZZ08_954 [Pseudomonadota bacterium]|jgi:hypothetical protein
MTKILPDAGRGTAAAGGGGGERANPRNTFTGASPA